MEKLAVGDAKSVCQSSLKVRILMMLHRQETTIQSGFFPTNQIELPFNRKAKKQLRVECGTNCLSSLRMDWQMGTETEMKGEQKEAFKLGSLLGFHNLTEQL